MKYVMLFSVSLPLVLGVFFLRYGYISSYFEYCQGVFLATLLWLLLLLVVKLIK